MTQSSERLVVFVTPLQKRALTARAARLGISLSELVRRAVLAFEDTGPEVRAAGLVDRLSAARDQAGDDALRRLAAEQGVDPAAIGQAGCAPAAIAPAHGTGAETENDARTALPVAAAVARALEAQAKARERHAGRHTTADLATEALVARVIAHESRGETARSNMPPTPASPHPSLDAPLAPAAPRITDDGSA